MAKTKHEIKNEDWNKHYAEKVYTTGADIKFVVDYHKFELPKDKMVLDVGVGYGNFVRELSETNTMIGVDVSKMLLEIAENKYCAGIENIEYCLNNGVNLDSFESNSLEYVFSMGVFQHITSFDVIASYIREALRVLKGEITAKDYTEENMVKTNLPNHDN